MRRQLTAPRLHRGQEPLTAGSATRCAARLNLLGRPHLVDREGDETALQPLSLAVLAYLAAGGPRDRDHLAELFWHGSKNGLNSLSTTLNRIRAAVPGGLWVRGNSLVGTDLVSDVCDLRDAFERSDFETVTRLHEASFLGSLKLRRQSPEFEEWVLDTRTNLASMTEVTLLQRGRDLLDIGEYRAAAIAAEKAWEITMRDGFPSPDYFKVYHRILASASRPTSNVVRTMAKEFGIELELVEPMALGPNRSRTTRLITDFNRNPDAEQDIPQRFGVKRRATKPVAAYLQEAQVA